MRNDGVLDALTNLLNADPDLADRDQIGAMIRRNAHIRGWVDAADIRFTRRLHQLAAQGASEAAGMALTDEGRRSGKEAKATEDREQVCATFPALEDALATGAVSADHLDVLARLTKNLTEIERSDLDAAADTMIASATTDYVSEFERKTRNMINEIRNTHRPNDDAAELDRQRNQSAIKRWVDKISGIHKTLIECDPIRDAAVHAAIDAQLARLKQQAGSDNTTVPFGSLHVDALVAATSADQPGRARIPEISLLIDQRSACHGQHPDTICETSSGVALPVTTVQRLCCDANIHAILLDDNGEALNVGRERRTATRAQRRALRAMQRTCAHPHCTISFDNCRIHHIVWWRNLGNTNIDNMLALCEQHHHLVHEGRWTLTMTTRRIATWTRPDGTHWHTGPTTNRTHHTNHPTRTTTTRTPTASTAASRAASCGTAPAETATSATAQSGTAPTGTAPVETATSATTQPGTAASVAAPAVATNSGNPPSGTAPVGTASAGNQASTTATSRPARPRKPSPRPATAAKHPSTTGPPGQPSYGSAATRQTAARAGTARPGSGRPIPTTQSLLATTAGIEGLPNHHTHRTHDDPPQRESPARRAAHGECPVEANPETAMQLQPRTTTSREHTVRGDRTRELPISRPSDTEMMGRTSAQLHRSLATIPSVGSTSSQHSMSRRSMSPPRDRRIRPHVVCSCCR